ncbi:tail fiber domain-containing protein [Burkholderia arboris]|uniref:tail fiber domain-containing protein n=1 Tax=Burkholderia arboris TaxID=488730 RepID=UPI001CF22D09|nr:tail fiber domain-containing protein [Burkholderia arboris]MCA8035389.1 tail fiber domain-containing protein [Burkholderia arboris]
MDYPKSVPGVGLVDGKFVDEDPNGQIGSLIPSKWGNDLTDEVLNVLREAGINPDEATTTQLRDAVLAIAQRSVAGSIASQVEAEAGEDNTKLMTPLRVAQATENKQEALGFTPVQQGTGIDQSQNTVKIGWKEGVGLKATVDDSDFGAFVFDRELDGYATHDWVRSYAVKSGDGVPYMLTTNNERTSAWISINGQDGGMLWTGRNFDPNTKAPVRVSNGGYGYVISDSGNVITQNWNNRDRIDVYIDGQFQGAMAYTRDVAGKANQSDLDWTNGQLGGKFHATDGRISSGWAAGNGFLAITVDGAGYGVPIQPSDRRLKENVKPSRGEGLEVIDKIELYSFNYKDNGFFDASVTYHMGFVAQQLHAVDPTFVIGEPDGEMMMSPNLLPIVAHLVKATQELRAELEVLRSALLKSE